MKYRRPSSAPTRRPARRLAAVGPTRHLIRLNTDAIRSRELKAHARIERQLARLTEQLHRFQAEDQPGFLRWLHATFGPLLARHREILNDIAAKQAIFCAVEELAARFRIPVIDAYRKYLHRQAHPEEALAEDQKWEERQRARRPSPPPDDETEFDGAEDPSADHPHWREFEKYFSRFFSHARTSDEDAIPPTVRELYRALVRRLHPDRHGALSEARAGLWHETQQAYQRRDIEALQGLLARCEAGDVGLGAHTSVSAIRSLIDRLTRSIRRIQKELRAAKKQTAWGYRSKIENPVFVLSIKTELLSRVRRSEQERMQLAWELEEMERIVRAIGPTAGRGGTRRVRRTPA